MSWQVWGAVLAVLLFAASAIAEDVGEKVESARQLALQGHPQRAFAELQQLAARGNAKAQLYAGIMLAAGEGTTVDRPEAVKLWLLAADQNLVEAQFRLGLAYAAGEGVPIDQVEGAKWLILSGAEDGMTYQLISEALSEAQISDARRRAEDWRKANERNRFSAAMEADRGRPGSMQLSALAKEGYAPAQYELALLHQLGIPDAAPGTFPGTFEFRPDEKEAVRYLRLAAEQEYAPAISRLAAALEAGRGVERDYSEALALYEIATKKGSREGKWGLARMLLDGKGTEANWGRGIGLLTEVASSTQYYAAQAELAERYADQPGADLRLAYMWYAVAAHNARRDSMDWWADRYEQARTLIEPVMSGGEIDTAKAMAGTCLRTRYRRCRTPELLDGLFDLVGL